MKNLFLEEQLGPFPSIDLPVHLSGVRCSSEVVGTSPLCQGWILWMQKGYLNKKKKLIYSVQFKVLLLFVFPDFSFFELSIYSLFLAKWFPLLSTFWLGSDWTAAWSPVRPAWASLGARKCTHINLERDQREPLQGPGTAPAAGSHGLTLQ